MPCCQEPHICRKHQTDSPQTLFATTWICCKHKSGFNYSVCVCVSIVPGMMQFPPSALQQAVRVTDPKLN